MTRGAQGDATYISCAIFIFPVWLTVFTEALVVASKEIGLEVSADKTKYMVMSR